MYIEELGENETAVFGLVPVGTPPPLLLAGADDEDDAESFTLVRGID
ncbi:hypothetical protein [Streptomyces sp. NPDC001816]